MNTYSSNVATVAADVVGMETDTTCVLGNDSALLQSVEDSFNTVISHGQQKAALLSF
jgi:hypothetical protein